MGAQIRTAVWEEKRLSFVQQEGKRRDGIPCGCSPLGKGRMRTWCGESPVRTHHLEGEGEGRAKTAGERDRRRSEVEGGCLPCRRRPGWRPRAWTAGAEGLRRLGVALLAWQPMAGRGVGNRPVRLSSTPRTRMGREGKSGVVVTVARRWCRADGFPSTTPMIHARRERRRDRFFPCCGMREIAGDCAA